MEVEIYLKGTEGRITIQQAIFLYCSLCYYFQSKNYLHILLSCLIDRFAIYRCKPSVTDCEPYVILLSTLHPSNMTLKEVQKKYSQDSNLSTLMILLLDFYELKRRFCNL